jgi:integrase
VARSVHADIASRSRRLRLPIRREPYYQVLQQGLALGYYRPTAGGDGTWWGRVRIGARYMVEALATADDHVEADGTSILSWPQAQAAVRAWAIHQTGAGPLTVTGVAQTYLDDLRARKGDKAARSAQGRLNKHLLPALGDRLAAELTAADLTAWRNGLVPAAGDAEHIRRARDTANRVLNIVKASLNFAFQTGRLADDRAWRRVGGFKNAGVARKVILDEGELQLLVDACGPGLRELVAVGAQTGARLGELTAACVRDFDPTAGTLHVCGKTGAREIYLAEQTVLLLRRAASGRRPDDKLLPPLDRPAWTKNLHHKRFAAAVRTAGLDPAATFYALRHSYISHALKRLVPVKALSDHCGTSMQMIERHYARFIVADRRRYAEIGAPELQIDRSECKVAKLSRA